MKDEFFSLSILYSFNSQHSLVNLQSLITFSETS